MDNISLDRAPFDAAQAAMLALRVNGEDGLIINLGVHGPTQDCRNGYLSATILKGEDEFTGEAVNLIDAVLIARGRLEATAKRRAEEKAEKSAGGAA